jgi:hypothetical protein
MFGGYQSLLRPAATTVLVLITFACYSQKARVVGKTLNGITDEPVPFANVYFNGTSIGTASDSLGRFEINEVSTEFFELVASSIGFRPLSANLKLVPNKTTVVEFKMVPDVTMLSSIVIRDKRDKRWEGLYNDFCNYFIGQTNNAKQTTISNPEVLDLSYDPSSKTLTASASEPIQLENLALGYHISVTLEKFEASDRHNLIQIKTYFNNITPKNELQALQWQKNRVETYKGSKRHFFLSLIRGTIEGEGFSVQKSSISPHADRSDFTQDGNFGSYSPNLKMDDLLSDSTEGNFKVMESGIFKISYRRSDEDLTGESTTTSWIEVNDPHLNIYANGNVKLPASFWLLGYFEKLRLADQLPSDYNFWEEEMRLFRSSNMGRGKLIGMVLDESDNALSGAIIFINNGLTQTITNHWGQFEFDGLPSGEYPMVFTHHTMQPILKVIPIDTSELAEAVVTMKAKVVDLMSYEPVNKKAQKQVVRAIHPRYREVKLSIVNPENLYFKNEGKTTRLIAEKPLIFVSAKLGYQWTFYVKDLSIANRELTRQGYFKFDTLKPKNSKEKEEWLANRRRAYRGTWNQFLTSLIDGKLLESAIEVYDDSSAQKKKPISYDSLIELKNGKMLLTLRKKAKVQFQQTGSRNEKVKSLDLDPKVARIQISKSGVFDPFKLAVSSPGSGKLPLTPIDQSFVKKEFRKTGTNTLVEKIHLQTDKPYYYPGDTIWFKGFLAYEFKTESSLTSKVLYVDLVNDKGVLVRSLKVWIENGKTNGDLFLYEDLPRGDYTLRAYTRYSAAHNYFFFKPIPILRLNESIESNENDKDVIHPDLSTRLVKEKEVFKLGDTIRLTLEVTENGQTTSGEFSVAVTDQLSVGSLENTNPRTLPFSAMEIYQRSEVSLQPEQGLTHRVRILDGDASKAYSLSALVTKNATAVSTTISGNLGSFVLNYDDSTTIFLKCTDSKNKEYEVEFLNYEIPITLLPEPLRYQTKKGGPRSNLFSYTSSDSVALLDEVLITSKRIVRQQKPVESILGNVYTTLNDRQLQNIRKTKDLVEELHTAIPQLNNPLIRFYLFVNGRIEDPYILPTFPANQISRVDVYPRPMNAVAIFTESMIPYNGKNPNLYQLMGFSTRHKFYGGNSEFNDLRSTVYWNPTVRIKSGVGSFEFPTSKSVGSYKVVLEGVTDTGKFFRIVDYLKIRE